MSSLYPIISKYDIDLKSVSLTEPNTYVKDHTGMKSSYFTHNLNYNYDRIGVDKLCVMTQFLKIALKPHFIGSPMNNTGKIHFSVDINGNVKLKALLMEIFEATKAHIMARYPNVVNVDYPIVTKGDKEYFNISLMQFDKKVTTPIHYHRTKKQGGNVITIVNRPIGDISKELEKEMNLFKSFGYGKKKKPYEDIDDIENKEGDKSVDTKKIVPKELYYEGKFTLMFSVEYAEFDLKVENQILEKKIRCKIKMFAKEMETKYNVSRVQSVLDIDVTNLNKVNMKQPVSIAI